MTTHHILKQFFGYETFRPLQENIIDAVIEGKDSLVLMPTGGGKSLCYQVPALYFEGLTIVISPLIALMKDQVEALRGNGVKASFINSSLSQSEQDAVLWAAKLGELKLLYVAPEKLFAGNMLEFLKGIKLSLIAVDESHCISSWGHDFRPEYRQLSVLKDTFPEVPVIALTATADKVTRKDICRQLGIPEENTFISGFDRPNISLEVLPGRNRLKQIMDFLKTVPEQSGIIYCLSRNGTESLTASLIQNGYKADFYHAGLDSQRRSKVQEAFIKDDLQIIVATIAFGMGIDKSNVRWIIHYNLPGNVESFYQEIGRAGRDGTKARTALFYTYADIMTRKSMIEKSNLDDNQKELMNAKLDRMQQYAEANICRRRILLSYFNEEVGQDCGNCDVCLHPRERFDATILAQKALSGVARTGEKVAMGMLIDILRGSRNQNLLRLGYDKLTTFGIGKDLKYEEWADYLSQILNYGALDIAYDEGHVFKLNEVSWQLLKGKRKIELSHYITFEERKKAEEVFADPKKTKKEFIKNELFDKLKLLRKQIADSLGIPPYIVFNDATLLEMAHERPITKARLLNVSGVGEEKFRRYGDTFITEILSFVKGNSDQGVKLAKGLTYIETLDLYNEGLSVEEIAERRKLSRNTIYQHLIKLFEEGQGVDLWKFIDKKTYRKVVEAMETFEAEGTFSARAVYEHFQEGISYEEIRIAMALSKKAKEEQADSY